VYATAISDDDDDDENYEDVCNCRYIWFIYIL